MLLLPVLLLGVLAGRADERSELQRLQKLEEARYHEREGKIAVELAHLPDHPWAGVYGRSNGVGIESLALAPRVGAAYGSPGCLGLLALNHGELTRGGLDGIEVAWRIDPALDTFDYLGKRQPRLSTKLLVIPWGPERYLVPERRLVEFTNAVNSRDPLLVARFWKRGQVPLIGASKLPEGLPELHETLRPWLLDSPVRCRATKAVDVAQPAVDGVVHYWREVEIDAGSAQKLRAGMCFFAPTVDPTGELAGEVVELREKSARVEFRRFETNSQRTALKVGTELSTRAPKR